MVEFRGISNLGWHYDGSGNLTAFDTSGNTIVKLIGGSLSVTGNKATAFVASVASTNSASNVSTGLGVNITPQVATTLIVLVSASGSSDTASDGGGIAVYRTTGSIPSRGSAVSGTLLNGAGNAISPSANSKENLSFTAIDTGLTAGTAYNYYVAYVTSGAGNFSLQSLTITVFEF